MNASHYTSLSRVDHKKGKNKKENLLITKYFFYNLLGFDMSQAIYIYSLISWETWQNLFKFYNKYQRFHISSKWNARKNHRATSQTQFSEVSVWQYNYCSFRVSFYMFRSSYVKSISPFYKDTWSVS